MTYTVEGIKALLEKVTPGTWEVSPNKQLLLSENLEPIVAFINRAYTTKKQQILTDQFIAQSKSIVEWLLKENEELEGTIRDMRTALENISRSAPCFVGHQSFNSPGQPCDQRIAEEVLAKHTNRNAESVDSKDESKGA